MNDVETQMVYPQGTYDVRRNIGVRVWFYVTAVVWPMVGMVMLRLGYGTAVVVTAIALAFLMVCSWGAWKVRVPKR